MVNYNTRKYGFYLFLMGLFSLTQVRIIGSIGISEIVICLVSPFVFLADYHLLKRDGFLTVVWLSISVMVGCVVACIVNETPLPAGIRGFATTYVMFSAIIVGHRLIRMCPMGVKWFYLGVAFSVTVNIFIFQTATELSIYGGGMSGLDAAEGIMNSPIFWIGRIQEWIFLPLRGWYLTTPTIYSIFAPIAFAIFSILTSISGRSAAATTLMMAVIVILGGKKITHLRLLSRNSYLFLIVGFVFVSLISTSYKYMAKQGLLGEEALVKYEGQMKGRKDAGLLTMLMAGRVEFFVGGYACLRKPFVGYGPWAIDHEGLYESFIKKYGDADDYAAFDKIQRWNYRYGYLPRVFIPAHSFIISYWLWYGIAGMIFWLYVLFQYVRYFRKDLGTVPQWFGTLAVFAVPFLWNFFFSPLGARVPTAFFIVLIMMTRAIRWGSVCLPQEMLLEIERKSR